LESSLNPIEKTYRRLKLSGKTPVRLFSGNPTLQGIHFPESLLQQAYRAALQNPRYEPHPKGSHEARAAVSRYYLEQGISLDPERILLTSGTSESFFLLFQALSQPGDHFLAPQPAYPLFDHLAQMARIELKTYPLHADQNWDFSTTELEDLITEKTKGIILISPHNPTGAVCSSDRLQGLADLCRNFSLPLICDEVFSEFIWTSQPYPRPMTLKDFPLVFTLNGISKMLALPGHKIGWIAATGKDSRLEEMMDRLENGADTFLSCNQLIQKVLPALLHDAGKFISGYREEVRRRRELALALLRSQKHFRFRDPQGGFTMMVENLEAGGLDEEEWTIALMEATGVFVHPGYFFDYERGVHFIFSFLTEPEILEASLKKIIDFRIANRR
jgi:alanine-synthesizing transaminase